LAIELTEDAKLWCDQNQIPYNQFQKVRDLFDGDDGIQQKYKELFTYDGNGNGKTDNKNKNAKETKKPIYVKKYTAKGTIPLHESVVIGQKRKFVYLDSYKNPIFVDSVERIDDTLIPTDTFDTQNPIPFIFESEQKFQECLEHAKAETLETLFLKVETINRKYVDMEDHYHVLLTADMIWTWLQDKFGYTHYVIIIGDNGSGKNSQLLSFRFLGYRVFYTISATAPNYFTKMGNVEEGQLTTAEDEADDIAKDKDKRNIIKNGYASGGSVPKVELEGGRKSDDWLVYCQKWFAMEELPTLREMKGILDRSFVLKFVAGTPQYNIKDVMNSAGAPKFKPLYDELIETRNILLCWRLLHHHDVIPDIDLNIKNRSAELTKPLIRLFQNSPIALEKILNSLSIFMSERKETKEASFESILYKVIEDLIEERELELKKKDPIDDLLTLGKLSFTNWSIRNSSKEKMDGEDMEDKPGSFWSPLEGIGSVSQTRITSTCKSRFKAKSDSIRLSDKTHRILTFSEDVLKRVKSNYEMVDKIEIQKSVTLVTDVTLCGENSSTKKDIFNENHEGNNTNKDNKTLQNQGTNLLETVTSVTSVTKDDSLTNKDQSVTDIETKSLTRANSNPNLSKLIKIEGTPRRDGEGLTYEIHKGGFILQNNFITGQVKMRGNGGGAYPSNYLALIDSIFGSEENTIEVCSRTVHGDCFTVDINPEHKPDLVIDGQTLEGIRDNSFSRWRCDPPYSIEAAAKMYGTELPKISELLKAGCRVVKPGSLLFLLHSNHGPSKIAELKRIGYLTISTIPNNETRILNIYVKLPEQEGGDMIE